MIVMISFKYRPILKLLNVGQWNLMNPVSVKVRSAATTGTAPKGSGFFSAFDLYQPYAKDSVQSYTDLASNLPVKLSILTDMLCLAKLCIRNTASFSSTSLDVFDGPVKCRKSEFDTMP